MANHWHNTTGDYSFRFFSPEEVDRILRDGARLGRSGSHAAIERILKLEPEVDRVDLWQRIRQLKHPSRETRGRRSVWSAEDDQLLSRGYQKGWLGKQQAVRELLRRHSEWGPHVIWKRAAKLGLAAGRAKPRVPPESLPWSENENRILLDHAGYDRVDVIGELLGRSANAVRCRLSRLRESGRVSDGYTRRGLADFLHVGYRVVQRWIVLGRLKVRDSRISQESLEIFAKEHAPQLQLAIDQSENSPVDGAKQKAGYTWAKIAKRFGVNSETVEDWIMRGWLKFCDPQITDRSFEDFCKEHGSEINCDLLGQDARKWLIESMGLLTDRGSDNSRNELAPALRHTRKVRYCEGCHKPFRGNVYFRHIKTCPNLKSGTATGIG